MDHDQFWSVVADARGSATALVRALATLPAHDIAGFDVWWWAYYVATSREDLWAAVFAINGGCSDDRFDYFRAWLIGRGAAALVAAVNDPESLAELIGDADATDESWMSVARSAYAKAGYGELPDSRSDVAIPGRDEWPADRFASGLKWDKPFYAAHFPKLYARYVASWDDPPVGAIDHPRYWAIVEQAGGDVDRLAAILRALPLEELVGFDRWHTTYNRALNRNDMRVACRLALGKDDSDTVAGFRGWLMLQGSGAVQAAMRDLDSMLAATRPATCVSALVVTWRPLEARGIYEKQHDVLETIPDGHDWRADWQEREPTVAERRERFPRLTAARGDRELGAPIAVSMMTDYERQRVAVDHYERARGCSDARERLALLDAALAVWPRNIEALSLRGRTHVELGNGDAALADFDAVLAGTPHAEATWWERAQLRLARGDRDGAISDAREAAYRVEAARVWLASLVEGTPRGVRHSKFGDGTVVSADATGSEPKLVIDFASGRKTIARRFVEAID
jgi:tetratricopeptide (TPR) repeat protein